MIDNIIEKIEKLELQLTSARNEYNEADGDWKWLYMDDLFMLQDEIDNLYINNRPKKDRTRTCNKWLRNHKRQDHGSSHQRKQRIYLEKRDLWYQNEKTSYIDDYDYQNEPKKIVVIRKRIEYATAGTEDFIPNEMEPEDTLNPIIIASTCNRRGFTSKTYV